MPGTAEGKELVTPSRSLSVVWKYFGFCATDVNQEEIICKECCGAVSARQSNTNNLFNHVKKTTTNCGIINA